MKLIQRTFVLCAIALTFFMLGTSQSNAGIVLDSNGIVTSFTHSATDTTVYFYQGSYNDNQTFITHFDMDHSRELVIKLAEELDTYSGPSEPSFFAMYWFVVSTTDSIFSGNPTYGPDPYGSWVAGIFPEERPRTLYDDPGMVNYYMASTTNPSGGGVPEPSTAIAMGLLGIVGFAGNRRRRRTALNA